MGARENKLLFDRAGALWDSGYPKEAFRIYRALAKQGHAGAMLNLGHFYDMGRGVRASREKAIHWWEKLARNRDGLAATNLGCLARREGQPQVALRWFKKAIAWGDDDAYLFLGSLYLGPLGNGRKAESAFRRVLGPKTWVTQESLDDAAAALNYLRFSRKSLRRTNLDALDRATFLAEAGYAREAFLLFRRLAREGDPTAFCWIAIAYIEGQGVQRSVQKGLYWERRWAKRRHSRSAAAHNLACTYRDLRRPKLALKWFRKSVAWGDNDESLLEIAALYMGALDDRRKAKAALERFARSDQTFCQANEETGARLLKLFAGKREAYPRGAKVTRRRSEWIRLGHTL